MSKKILKITYALPMLFIGMIIGGAVGGSKPLWVSALVLLIADILIGLFLQYRTDGPAGVMPTGFLRKAARLMRDPDNVQYISIAEISAGLVNLRQARTELPQEQFRYVLTVYTIMQEIKVKKPMDLERFTFTGNSLIAMFDMIAPFYKYAGKSGLPVDEYRESMKDIYREEARQLIMDGKFLEDEWQELHEEFMEKFHM